MKFVYLFNPLNPELNPICYLLALLAHHFLHASRIRVKILNKWIDYHQTWHWCHASGGHPTMILSHFLESQHVIKWNVYRNKIISLADRKMSCYSFIIICHVLQHILLNSRNLSFSLTSSLSQSVKKKKQSIYYIILLGVTVVYRPDRHFYITHSFVIKNV